MINKLLQFIAPHHCYECGQIGTTLCDNCEYNIASEPFSGCIVCAQPAAAGICKTCQTSYDKAWCVGQREGGLERLINAYKFERVKAAHEPLASLLDQRVEQLPSNVTVLSVPTVSSHIRVRGYDHAALIAKRFSRRRGLRYESLLLRTSASVQRGASKKQRLEQAKSAFSCRRPPHSDQIYLLIDDVVTTNATLRYAAQTLKEAGATQVWVAVIARQPLDNSA